jgi:hypothetical protein
LKWPQPVPGFGYFFGNPYVDRHRIGAAFSKSIARKTKNETVSNDYSMFTERCWLHFFTMFTHRQPYFYLRFSGGEFGPCETVVVVSFLKLP